jgi:hypothetical protein
MKTVFKSNEIAHIWAHESAQHGRCRGNESFNGRSYYSYATEIARIIEHKRQKAHLLNTTSYSVTTSSHQNGVARAIPKNATVFKIGDFGRGISLDNVTGSMLFDYSIKQAAQCADKATRARIHKNWHLVEQADWIKQAKQVCVFFGLHRKVDDKAIERLSKRIAEEKKHQAKLEKERQVKLEKENAETIEKWLRGENVYFPYRVERVYLRRIGDEMETSLGVRVPIQDAKRAYQFVTKHKEDAWRRNGQQFSIGNYELDSVNQNGVIAGCHRVTWDEIERFAKLQGWNNN